MVTPASKKCARVSSGQKSRERTAAANEESCLDFGMVGTGGSSASGGGEEVSTAVEEAAAGGGSGEAPEEVAAGGGSESGEAPAGFGFNVQLIGGNNIEESEAQSTSNK